MKSARVDELKRYLRYLQTEEAQEDMTRGDYWRSLEWAWQELNDLFEAGYYGEEEAVYIINCEEV